MFCFGGPPGVGRTHLAKVLAATLYADKNHLHFFDMSQAATPMGANALFGSPKGYIGSTSYGALTAALRDVPNAVVLLDEFEKAHPEVHKRFLTAWNDGFWCQPTQRRREDPDQRRDLHSDHQCRFAPHRDGAAAQRLARRARPHGEVGAGRRAICTGGSVAYRRGFCVPRAQGSRHRARRRLGDRRFPGQAIRSRDRVWRKSSRAFYSGSIDTLSKQQPAGGVRDIARTIEKQITDGLIDAKAAGAKRIRLVADGERIKVVPEHDDAPAQPVAGGSSGLAEAT